jgi:UrcA family protein
VATRVRRPGGNRQSAAPPAAAAPIAAIAFLTYFACVASLLPQIGHGNPPLTRPAETVSTTVSLSDLDLSNPEGMATARVRLTQKAVHLCLKFSDPRRISNSQTLADCTEDAVARSLHQLRAHSSHEGPSSH